VLTLAALAIRLVVLNSTRLRLALAAAATVVALLFRHDYAVYVAIGIIAGLVARDPGTSRTTASRVALYAGFTSILLLPSTIWIQIYEGLPAYIRSSLNSAATEARRTGLDDWPSLDLTAPLHTQTLLSLTYYAFWTMIAAGATVLAWRLASRSHRLDSIERGTGIGLLALAAVVSFFFLRANLGQRVGDAVVPVVLLVAWAAGAAAAGRSRHMRLAAFAGANVLLASTIATLYTPGEIERELDTSGLSESWEKTRRRFASARAELARLPPEPWTDADEQGTLVAARYIAECTSPDDYILVATYAPELTVYARRRFAGGQATIGFAFYTSDADQRRALARLEQQPVPLVLAHSERFTEEFSDDYPLLARYVAERYVEAGSIVVEKKPRFRVFVDRARQTRRMDPQLGLPCFR
jgi:hypothetical protein